jgi:hypothetical protein
MKFGVAKLKVVYRDLVDDCSDRGRREGSQKMELGSKKAKLLLECTEKNSCK